MALESPRNLGRLGFGFQLLATGAVIVFDGQLAKLLIGGGLFAIGLAAMALGAWPSLSGLRWRSPITTRVGRESAVVADAAPSQRRPRISDLDKHGISLVRMLAGQMNERVGDWGAPLAGQEDQDYREKWKTIREQTGSLAHHQDLRQALRDFDNRFGWMMRYKSAGTYGGKKEFDSAEEQTAAHTELEAAYQVLVRACNALLGG